VAAPELKQIDLFEKMRWAAASAARERPLASARP
jgi:hypothetical protein